MSLYLREPGVPAIRIAGYPKRRRDEPNRVHLPAAQQPEPRYADFLGGEATVRHDEDLLATA